MPVEDVRTSDEPVDRLTELCAVMTSSIDRPENIDVKGIIFLNADDMGGIEMFGYEDMADCLAALLIHMQAMFQSMGKDFGVMTDAGVMMLPVDRL